MGAPQYGTPPPPGGYGQPPGGYGQAPGGYGQPPGGYWQSPGGYGGGMMLQPADVGKRLIAYIIDWAIVSGASLVIYVPLARVLAAIRLPFLGAFVGLAVGALGFLYKPYFEATKDGQTIGKKMQGIKVVKQDGTPCDWGAALLRQVVFLIPFFIFVELILILTKDDRLRVGDMVAKTTVVDAGAVPMSGAGYPQAGYGAPPPPPPPPQAPQPAQPPMPPQQPAAPAPPAGAPLPPQPQVPQVPPSPPPPQAPPAPPQAPPPPPPQAPPPPPPPQAPPPPPPPQG